jgi:hypothetical protein
MSRELYHREDSAPSAGAGDAGRVGVRQHHDEDHGEEPIAVVRGTMLLLRSCPLCNGSPQISCARCGPDLQALGVSVFHILSDQLATEEVR